MISKEYLSRRIVASVIGNNKNNGPNKSRLNNEVDVGVAVSPVFTMKRRTGFEN
jgi:hypothetical protein